MREKMICVMAIVSCLALTLAGCGRGTVDADLGVALTDVGAIAVPEDVQVVGLGEASHGVREYQEMKAKVFQALVENSGCRTLVIEGDFGCALKVDDYIHGGEGTAKEAAARIGFQGEDLHFYRMDMQWAEQRVCIPRIGTDCPGCL